MVVIDEDAHSEHVQVIRCDFRPGSVERSIDQDKEGIPKQAISLPIKIEKFPSGYKNPQAIFQI
jgi:hypothetical protein